MRTLPLRTLLRAAAFTAVLGSTLPLHAATFYFDPVQVTLGNGQTHATSLLINPTGESINAVAGSVRIPTSHIELVDITTNDSVVDLWIEQPELTGEMVRFAGIMPRGFDGIRKPYGDERKSGILLTLHYRALEEGSVPLVIEGVEAYLNDGNATPAEVEVVPGVVDIVRNARNLQTDTPLDVTPPERFVPLIVRDAALHDGKYVVVFHTVDRGSGVDHYEVAEVAADETVQDGDWRTAHSPHVLNDQDNVHDVYVKAVDRSGNERVEMATSEDVPQKSDERALPLGILAVLFVLAAVLFFIRRRHFKT